MTLEAILNTLVKRHGWRYLSEKIRVRCFKENPSIKSSLTFLRKTPWARAKLEQMYVWGLRKKEDSKQV